MPRRDIYHEQVAADLESEGWTITDDPLHVSLGDADVYVDLAAERILGAVKGETKIAIEIKSFVGASVMNDLEMALGQFILYRDMLSVVEPDRIMYLALPKRTFKGILTRRVGSLIVERNQLRLIVFDEEQERGLEWLPQP